MHIWSIVHRYGSDKEENMEKLEIHLPTKTWEHTNNVLDARTRLSIKAFNTLVDICNKTGLPMSRVASTLILEAERYVVYDKMEE